MALFPRSKQLFCHVLAIFTLLFLSTKNVRLEPIKLVPHFMSNTEFLRTSCGVTLYPDICFKTLSNYSATIRTSPLELTNAALNVSLISAESTSNLVSKLSKEQQYLTPREAGALTDCLENMENSVDELKESLIAMRDLEGADFDLEKSNIQTWVSAALTEEDTCLDGFEENAVDGDIKAIIRGNIVTVGQLTSNALALVNRLSPSRFHSP